LLFINGIVKFKQTQEVYFISNKVISFM